MIRFVRVGRKNQAYFHLVVAEKARAVQKKILEKLGHLSPHVNKGEGEFIFDADRIKHYIKNGAQMSQTAARLLTKNGLKEAGAFVEQRATKPKKTPAPTEAPIVSDSVEETKEEEVKESDSGEASSSVETSPDKTPDKEAPAEEEKKSDSDESTPDKEEVKEEKAE